MAFPALLFVVRPEPFKEAVQEFADGKREIYFRTNANIDEALELRPSHIYFKVAGSPEMVAEAILIEVTSTNPGGSKRLIGMEEDEGRFFCGFRNLGFINPIPLTSVKYFNTEAHVPHTQAGACIIEEP
jgi:hypothetical protein